MDLLLNFGRWLQNTTWALSITGSDWAYPFVQLIHFSGLSLWIGTILAVDFRLLGIGRDRQTAAQLSDSVFAWNWAGFAIAFVGGFMLFACSAETYLRNPAFLVKLGILVPAGLICHIFVQRKSRDWTTASELSRAARIAGLVELLLWLSVAAAAVLIPTVG
jgi:uncharacterized protein DUF6644